MDHAEIIRRAEPLLALIRKAEARSVYGVVYGGIPAHLRPLNLTSMTVGEVMDWQEEMVNKWKVASTAAGAYQIIRKTLREIHGVVGRNATFDKKTQDVLGAELLRKRGVIPFLQGKVSTVDMLLPLAQEWASFPVGRDMKGANRSVRRGQSYYAGDGLNKALVSVEDVLAALAACDRRASAPAPAPAVAKGFWATLLDALKGLLK